MESIKKLIVVSTLVALTISGYAKDLEGYIIKGKDSIPVTFAIPVNLPAIISNGAGTPQFEIIQKQVTYFIGQGMKQKLKPKDAEAIGFWNGSEYFRLVSKELPLAGGKKQVFVQAEKAGKVNLYAYILTSEANTAFPDRTMKSGGSATGMNYIKRYFIEKDGVIEKVKSAGFKKQMSGLFSDCSELVQLIEKKQKRTAIGVVSYYNMYCK